jgi:hypothetical protein
MRFYTELCALESMPLRSSPLYSWVHYQLTHCATMSVDHMLQLGALEFRNHLDRRSARATCNYGMCNDDCMLQCEYQTTF